MTESQPSMAGNNIRSRILIISYLFPPAGGIGVQRALSLARYLPASGFEVHVLRAGNAAAPVFDPALCKRVPDSVQIHNAFTPEAPSWLRHTVWNWLSRRKKEAVPEKGGDNNGKAATPNPKSGGLKSLATRTIRRVLSPEPEV